MRVPSEFASQSDALLVVRVKHPVLGELEWSKKLSELPETVAKDE